MKNGALNSHNFSPALGKNLRHAQILQQMNSAAQGEIWGFSSSTWGMGPSSAAASLQPLACAASPPPPGEEAEGARGQFLLLSIGRVQDTHLCRFVNRRHFWDSSLDIIPENKIPISCFPVPATKEKAVTYFLMSEFESFLVWAHLTYAKQKLVACFKKWEVSVFMAFLVVVVVCFIFNVLC